MVTMELMDLTNAAIRKINKVFPTHSVLSRVLALRGLWEGAMRDTTTAVTASYTV